MRTLDTQRGGDLPAGSHMVGLVVLAIAIALALFVSSSSAAAVSSPTIESVSVSGITEHDATLEAQINTWGSYTGLSLIHI